MSDCSVKGRVYILHTLFGEEEAVQVFINGDKDRVTFVGLSGMGIKYLLEAIGCKNVVLEYAQDEKERDCIWDKLRKLWDRSK